MQITHIHALDLYRYYNNPEIHKKSCDLTLIN